MPKSRFNAVREKARATRHNPLEGRKAGTSHEGSSSLPASSTILSPQQEDAIPILKSLPLTDGKGSQAADSSEVLWALTSLTSLLSEKSSRVQLLGPQHQLVARVLLQLDSERDIQIKDAASGCLRNLCIEAGSKARKALEEGNNIEKIIAEIHATAGQLALTSGVGAEEGEVWRKHVEEEKANKKQLLDALLQKPRDQLNKKEKRQLAKLEAAAGKSTSASNADDQEMNDASNQSSSIPVFLGAKNDEKILLTYSHLTNLVNIIWCLVEVSQSVANHCSRAAPGLCKIFTSVVMSAVGSIKALSEQSSSVEKSNHTGSIDVAKKDGVETHKAVIQLATSCLNALVTFTDSDQDFAAAVLGFGRQDLHLSRKTPAKSFVLDETETSSSRRDGVRTVAALLSTVAACDRLPRLADTGSADRTIQKQSESIALLSAAVIRNIQGCLPASLKDKVSIAQQGLVDSDTSSQNLNEVEMTVILPFLVRVLQGAAAVDAEKLLNGLQTDAHLQNGDHEMTPREKSAEEELNNLSLALEILAELVADPEGWSIETRRHRSNDTIEADDEEEEDEEMEEDEDESASSKHFESDDDGRELPLEDDIAMEAEPGESSFQQSRIAAFFSPRQLDALLMLGVEKQRGFASLQQGGSALEDNKAASLRSISIRALSVLNNQLLALASYASPPPSQPSKQEDEKVKSFCRWITAFQAGASGSQLGKIWRRVFEHASRVASLSCISKFEFANKEGRDARKVMEVCLCIMWSLSRCYEGVDGKVAGKALAIDATHFSADDFCQVSQHGVGVVASLIAAYKSSKRASSGSGAMQAPADAEDTTHQLAPTPDGIRIHSLGVLSTLIRQSFIGIDQKEEIISLIADTLEVLPNQSDLASHLNSTGLQDSTSIDAMVIAVNGIIDTFADETSEWDALYTKLRLQARLKRASVEVKTAARTVDKRKNPALRASADEAWSNLIAFVDYRAGLL